MEWINENWKDFIDGFLLASLVFGILSLPFAYRNRTITPSKDPFINASVSPDGEWEYGENGVVRKRKKEDQ